MKKVIITISLYLLFFQLINAQETPEAIASGFFELFNENNTQQAVEYLYRTNPNFDRADTLQSSTFYQNLVKAKKDFGTYCGFELSEKETISESFLKYVYLIKFEKSPVSITIYFYKPREKWQVTQVRLSNPIKMNSSGAPMRMVQKPKK